MQHNHEGRPHTITREEIGFAKQLIQDALGDKAAAACFTPKETSAVTRFTNDSRKSPRICELTGPAIQ
jgi:hypothetical protein